MTFPEPVRIPVGMSEGDARPAWTNPTRVASVWCEYGDEVVPHDPHYIDQIMCGGFAGMLKPLSIEVAEAKHNFSKFWEDDSKDRLDDAVKSYANNVRRTAWDLDALNRAHANRTKEMDKA